MLGVRGRGKQCPSVTRFRRGTVSLTGWIDNDGRTRRELRPFPCAGAAQRTTAKVRG